MKMEKLTQKSGTCHLNNDETERARQRTLGTGNVTVESTGKMRERCSFGWINKEYIPRKKQDRGGTDI